MSYSEKYVTSATVELHDRENHGNPSVTMWIMPRPTDISNEESVQASFAHRKRALRFTLAASGINVTFYDQDGSVAGEYPIIPHEDECCGIMTNSWKGMDSEFSEHVLTSATNTVDMLTLSFELAGIDDPGAIFAIMARRLPGVARVKEDEGGDERTEETMQ